MKLIIRTFLIFFLLMAFATMQTGCQREGTAEKAGKKIDKTYETAKDKFKEMTK